MSTDTDTAVQVEFRAKEGRSLSQEAAEEIGPEIHALMEQSEKSELTPQGFLDWVRSNPGSASHKHFDWDDTIAARRWRVHQARNIINSVEVKIIDNRDPSDFVPAFVNVITPKNDEGEATRAYSPFEVILNDPDKSQQVVERAFRDFMSWRRRYRRFRHLLPLADVFDATDEFAEETDD
jgi:hypothetical protein